MKVILKETVESLGQAGDIVKVSEGYARNYLLPQKKALPATQQNIKTIEQYKKSLLKQQAKTKEAAEVVAKKISEFHCVIEKRAGKNNKLFGAVTSQDIYKALLQQGFHVDKKGIEIESPLKETGDYEVSVRLHSEVKAPLKVTVKAEQ